MTIKNTLTAIEKRFAVTDAPSGRVYTAAQIIINNFRNHHPDYRDKDHSIPKDRDPVMVWVGVDPLGFEIEHGKQISLALVVDRLLKINASCKETAFVTFNGRGDGDFGCDIDVTFETIRIETAEEHTARLAYWEAVAQEMAREAELKALEKEDRDKRDYERLKAKYEGKSND